MSVQEITAGIAALLSKGLPSVIVAEEFADRDLYEPLEKPLLTVHIKKVLVSELSLHSYLGGGEDTAHYGKQADITLGLCVFSPAGGISPNRIFEDICDCLLFAADSPVRSLSRGETCYEEPYGVMKLTGEILCQGLLSRETSSLLFSRIQLQGEAK